MAVDSLLDQFDRDGALAETSAEALEGMDSRRSFLRKVGVGGGALVGASALAGVFPRIANAQIPASDIAILNFALTLEYLEAEFYAEAVAQNKVGGGVTRRFAQVVANHENTHVKFLKGVLGSKAVAKPRFDFKGTTGAKATFEATADVLENTGVHAYLGQVANIKTKAVLVGAGRILPVEARHAAWIRAIRYPKGGPPVAQTPAPAAFEDGFSKAKILQIVASTGFIVG
ncbi:MAG: ferritin-like domain-containing protein [Actinobacteria bacterium]|nr:ferritin-like domain-containing protein [Actinomycetota bacterium]